MSFKTNKQGLRILTDSESLCRHCDGTGLRTNKVCSECNGHGVVCVFEQDGFYSTEKYAPSKKQLAAMKTLGGVA